MKRVGKKLREDETKCDQYLSDQDLNFLTYVYRHSSLSAEDLRFIFENKVLRQPLIDSRDLLENIVKRGREYDVSPALYFLVHVRHLLLESEITDPAASEYIANRLLKTHLSMLNEKEEHNGTFDYPLLNIILIQEKGPLLKLILSHSNYQAVFTACE